MSDVASFVTMPVAKSEVESLQRALQLLLDGTQYLVRTLPPRSETNTIRAELVDYAKFASELLDWCGKMPAQRVRETLFSFLKYYYKFLQNAVQEGKLSPPNEAKETILPHMREILIELGPCITISQDRMAAFVIISSPMASLWTVEDLQECLKRRGIVYGVDETQLKSIFANQQFDQVVRVALGKPPIQGINATLEDPLQLLAKTSQFLHKESSRMDFKNQNLFVPIKAGQLILRKTPARAGENGCDIFGREIESPSGLDVEMPKIDNCERDETGLQLLSKVDGCAYSENDRIVVTAALTIPRNVDFESGNIKTNVSVTVNRDVLSNFSVESKQDIAVRGVIEAAVINAGGSVLCQGGINGKEKAVIQAGKNVEAAHVNGARVVAGGNVTINGPIIKSEVFGRRVHAAGGNGQIMGGAIHAWEDICASEIGSEMGVRTELILGEELGELKQRVDEFSENLKSMKRQKAQAEQALKTLRSNGGGDSSRIDQLLKALKKLNQDILERQRAFDGAIKDLAYSESCSRMVRAEKAIYAGTHIRILNRTLTIKKKCGPTTIVLANDKLVALPFKERSFNGHDVEDTE